jgi:hypothetical protein
MTVLSWSVVVCLGMTGPAAAAMSESVGGFGCGWDPRFAAAGPDGVVSAVAVFDEGSGPMLYVGGWFDAVGETVANNIARWDGHAWWPLAGPGGVGVDGGVVSLVVHDDGSGPALYVGGRFDTAGGLDVHNIARWDGRSWSVLDDGAAIGVDGEVRTLAVHGFDGVSELYAGGEFRTAGQTTASRIARWDGSSWHALQGVSGQGTNSSVWALAVHDDGTGQALYVAGTFSTAGGVDAGRVARWDGEAWSAVEAVAGGGVDGYVYALESFDDGSGPALYAGGEIEAADQAAVHNIVRWRAGAWEALSGPQGDGVSGRVSVIRARQDADGDVLYVGGMFTSAGGLEVNGVARWDRSGWSALGDQGGVGVRGSVAALTDSVGPGDRALVVAGLFTAAGGTAAVNLALWEGGHWLAFPMSSGLGVVDSGIPEVMAMAEFDDGTGTALYVAGRFEMVGTLTVNSIARWDGVRWSALTGPHGTGVDGQVYVLAVHDDGSGPALYVGGRFEYAGGVLANGIARWDGVTWSPLPGPDGVGTNHDVLAMATYDDGGGPALYVGGAFVFMAGLRVDSIARWDGSNWSELVWGPGFVGFDSAVWALTVFDDTLHGPCLYAGGEYLRYGNRLMGGIARWDGETWSSLDGELVSSTPGGVTSFAVGVAGSGPVLYAAHDWYDYSFVGRWDGSTWAQLGDDFQSRLGLPTVAMHDDGSGPSLYAGGRFTSASGVPARNLARWDGQTWSPVISGAGRDGVNELVHVLYSFDDGNGAALFAGGYFTSAGNTASSRVGVLRGRCPEPVQLPPGYSSR